MIVLLPLFSQTILADKKRCGKYSEDIDCTCNKNQEKLEVWGSLLRYCDEFRCYYQYVYVFKYAYCEK